MKRDEVYHYAIPGWRRLCGDPTGKSSRDLWSTATEQRLRDSVTCPACRAKIDHCGVLFPEVMP